MSLGPYPECPVALRKLIDKWITSDGEPFEDSLAIIGYTLQRALGPARGGMGEREAQELESLNIVLVRYLANSLEER